MKHVTEILSHAEIHQLVNRIYPTIIELGAHYGEDSQKFLDVFPQCQLWCFEPDPRCVFRFKQRIDDPRCKLLNMAVCDTVGRRVFHLSSGQPPTGFPDAECRTWDYSGSLNTPTGHLTHSPWCKFDQEIEVRTTTLDKMFANWLEDSRSDVRFIDFIWCDVQGAEHLVIAGGPRTLRRTRFFYTEFYEEPMYEGQLPLKELLKLLPAFEVVAIYGGENVLLANKEL